jgi:hypothetical protein
VLADCAQLARIDRSCEPTLTKQREEQQAKDRALADEFTQRDVRIAKLESELYAIKAKQRA